MSIESRRILVTPVGTLLLSARAGRLCGVVILAPGVEPPQPVGEGDPVLDRAAGQLAEYFAGTRRNFDLPLDLGGLPPFTRRVLEILAMLPCGATLSYGELAARAGNPRGARAVGRAMAVNPLPIVIPCHRVLAAGGRPGGYSGGGGLATKGRLLALERADRFGS